MDFLVLVALLTLVSFTGILALTLIIVYIVRRSINRHKNPPLITGVDLLQILKEAKLFPLGAAHGWQLADYQHEKRVWRRQITQDNYTAHVCSCYGKIKGSSQMVLNNLKDITKQPEWDPTSHHLEYVTKATEPTTPTKSKGSPGLPVQHDVIKAETSWTYNRAVRVINHMSSRVQGEGLITKLYVFHRYWHREDNGCCWLLELNEDTHHWCFYLAQPVEGWFEIDQCLLTVVCSVQDKSHCYGLPAYKLSALQNYILYRKLQCTPLTTISLPVDAVIEDATDSTTSSETKQSNIDELKSKVESTKGTFMQKFRTMIEERKSQSEEKKRKSVTSSPVKAEMVAAILNPHSTLQGSNVEENSSTSEASDLDSSMEKEPPQFVKQSSLSVTEKKKPLLKFLRSSSLPVSTEGPTIKDTQRNSLDLDLSPEKYFVPSSYGQNFISNGSSESDIEGNTSMKTPLSQELAAILEEEKIETGYRTVSNQTAGDIMAEKVMVSNIDINKSIEEQAESTGGWIFCGVEKDVVILKKIIDDGSSTLCYMGKGIIPSAPRTVFDALRNPRTRFTYDEMLKKMDVVHDFGNGLKILHLYHEVSQLFRKESRDFCVLQNERIEGDKFVISLRSVGWPGCPENDEVTRGKFLSSGWIVEPAYKDKALHSMATYIVQMDVGTSKTNAGYLAEELVAKQPVSIASLRHYLVPSSMLPSNQGVHRRKNVSE